MEEFMIITEIKKKEIEQLIPEHGDAFCWGANMYRQVYDCRSGICYWGRNGFPFEGARIILNIEIQTKF